MTAAAKQALAACLALLATNTGAQTMQDNRIPAQATQDAIMASPEEIREIHDWVLAASHSATGPVLPGVGVAFPAAGGRLGQC